MTLLTCMNIKGNTAHRLAKVLCVLSLLLVTHSHGADRVKVMGLFKNKAVVSINGVQRILTKGKPSPEGVILVKASSRDAVLEVNGVRSSYALGSEISTGFEAPADTDKEFQISADPRGMYNTVGSINGHPVSFLVDTGATVIAMNDAQARRLGIDYRVTGTPSVAKTASGIVRTYSVRLNSVKVGQIELGNVDAVVLEGNQPERTLLGMSFLGRLEMVNQGNLMKLRKKY